MTVVESIEGVLLEVRSARRPRRSNPPGVCAVSPAMTRALEAVELALDVVMRDPDPVVLLNLLEQVPTWMRHDAWYSARRAIVVLVTLPDDEASRETWRPGAA